SHTDDLLRQILEYAGHQVTYRSTRGAWKKALKIPADLLVAAGGDGTVRRVVLEAAALGLATPIAILPTGTANNIAKTIGAVGDARELMRVWASSKALPFDLGVVSAPWGRAQFVEAFGGGVIGALIERGEEIERGRSSVLGRETDRALHVLAESVRAS